MGFDFDKEYQALCVATPKLQRGTDWPRKTASALVTKAIDAFLADLGARAAFRYRDEHQGLEYAMATARTLIPKPPPRRRTRWRSTSSGWRRRAGRRGAYTETGRTGVRVCAWGASAWTSSPPSRRRRSREVPKQTD